MTLDAVKPRAPTRQQLRLQARAARERFKRARRAELTYARSLRAVGRQVGVIVRGLAPTGVVASAPQVAHALSQYSALLRPWAKSVAERMTSEVAQRDVKAWSELGAEIGRDLKSEIRRAPTGEAMRGLLEEQVELITSLPLEAAQRVHRLSVEALSGGTRAKETAKEILATGRVTESRAMLIARTETTRAATAMTQARATFIGSEGYVWRTAGDTDVRKLHRRLEGTFHRWGDPPVAGENGERAHAGAIYNCRCYPEPVLPEVIA